MKPLEWVMLAGAVVIAVAAVWWTWSAGIWPMQMRDDINDLTTRVETLEVDR